MTRLLAVIDSIFYTIFHRNMSMGAIIRPVRNLFAEAIDSIMMWIAIRISLIIIQRSLRESKKRREQAYRRR